MSAEIFVCRPGLIASRVRADLRKAGVIVVEIDDPKDCQFLRSSSILSADDLLWASLKALSTNTGLDAAKQRELFTSLLAGVIEKRRFADVTA